MAFQWLTFQNHLASLYRREMDETRREALPMVQGRAKSDVQGGAAGWGGVARFQTDLRWSRGVCGPASCGMGEGEAGVLSAAMEAVGVGRAPRILGQRPEGVCLAS